MVAREVVATPLLHVMAESTAKPCISRDTFHRAEALEIGSNQAPTPFTLGTNGVAPLRASPRLQLQLQLKSATVPDANSKAPIRSAEHGVAGIWRSGRE